MINIVFLRPLIPIQRRRILGVICPTWTLGLIIGVVPLIASGDYFVTFVQ